MKTVAFHTLGCKVNQYETQAMRESLQQAGYQTVSFDSQADIYIINTCTVTRKADQKSLQAIRRPLRLNPKAKVIAVGCYAQTNPKEITDAATVDALVGNEEKQDIADIVEKKTGKLRRITLNKSCIEAIRNLLNSAAYSDVDYLFRS